MKLYTGIDLHSNNAYCGILDERGQRVFSQRFPNDLSEILSRLEPFRQQMESITVESTFNWYWLVDGLMENGYPVCLANPAAMQQYEGLKNANDRTDAFFLAEMQRLGILPTGYIYPKEDRPVRDLLRRRMMLVQQRTAHKLSFQSLIYREKGTKLSNNKIVGLESSGVEELLDEEHLALMGTTNIEMIRYLTEKIRILEKAAQKRSQLKDSYKNLLMVPGIGKILGLTIMLESGEISRFNKVGNYTSYCRGVKAVHTSNEKKKAANNKKNGNKYLSWAYVEAANHAIRVYEPAKKFYQRKMARTNTIVAIKALASKLSKACYFMIRDNVAFNPNKILELRR